MKKIAGVMANLGFGGAEVQSILLFNELNRRGHKIRVFVLEDRRKELASRIDSGIEVIYIKRRSYIDLKAIKFLAENLNRNIPEYLVMVDSFPAFYGYIMKRFLKLELKGIAVIHYTVPPNFKIAVQNRILYGKILNRTDNVVFVSSKQKEYWHGRYRINKDRSIVIHNGVNLDYYDGFLDGTDICYERKKLGIPVDAFVVAMNAYLSPQKKHEHMLKALSQLKREGYNIFLLIIGDGERRKVLEEYARKLDMTDSVLFTGFVDDVRPYIACADVSALTSISETLSMAAIESMALGRALILSDTGGACEIVENGVNGYIYPPGEINGLVNSLKRIIVTGEAEVLGAKSFERARKHFSHKRMTDEYEKLLV
jgi:L-malate glycosyltransferase